MSRYISESLKKRVIQRVESCCEYCLMEATIKLLKMNEIDRIIERNE